VSISTWAPKNRMFGYLSSWLYIGFLVVVISPLCVHGRYVMSMSKSLVSKWLKYVGKWGRVD